MTSSCVLGTTGTFPTLADCTNNCSQRLLPSGTYMIRLTDDATNGCLTTRYSNGKFPPPIASKNTCNTTNPLNGNVFHYSADTLQLALTDGSNGCLAQLGGGGLGIAVCDPQLQAQNFVLSQYGTGPNSYTIATSSGAAQCIRNDVEGDFTSGTWLTTCRDSQERIRPEVRLNAIEVATAPPSGWTCSLT